MLKVVDWVQQWLNTRDFSIRTSATYTIYLSSSVVYKANSECKCVHSIYARSFTQHLLPQSSERNKGCGKAVAFNFPEVVNQANVFTVRAVSQASWVEGLAI